MELNIVEMMVSNPIVKITNTYNCILLEKMKKTFTETDQQMFLTSFYGYLNYNSKTDFVIDLDKIWRWLGFSQKVNVKTLLEKQFTENIDYINENSEKCLLLLQQKQSFEEDEEITKKRGGHNIQKIMMTIKTFKSLCLKAGTKKAVEIHEYYLKMEELLHETISEECEGLKLQLQEKTKSAQTEKDQLRQKTILDHFPDNVQCVYYGIIDDINSYGESLIKFGMSNYLRDRVTKHSKTFTNFRLVNAFKVDNKVQIENEIKHHPRLKPIRRKITLNKITHTELFVNSLTFEELDEIIKSIIVKIEYSPENYTKLLTENAKLLEEKNVLIHVIEKTVDPKITSKICKQSDGFYHIGDALFCILVGTRQEVWDEKAFKTSGGLTKTDLIINKHGKVISKSKYIICKTEPSRFLESDNKRREAYKERKKTTD